MCEAVISRDIDLHSGFFERVADGFSCLGSRGWKNGPVALIARISKKRNVKYNNCRFLSRRGTDILLSPFSLECFQVEISATYSTSVWLSMCVCVCLIKCDNTQQWHSAHKMITQKRSDQEIKKNLGSIKQFIKQYPHILTKTLLLSKNNEVRYICQYRSEL